MCGRYALYGPKSRSLQLKQDVTSRERALIQKFIDEYLERVAPRYSIAPQQGNPKNFAPIVRRGPGGELELAVVQWWLLPHWSKEPRIKHSTFNARIETVGSLASFRVVQTPPLPDPGERLVRMAGAAFGQPAVVPAPG